jgi:BirA family biotin operon repressor/biotin-[acetyl-CoA-carboxylase] ligase
LHDVLAELLAQSQFDIKIKWPNDMLVDGKKIAGILIENAFKENSIASSIVGIGLNVNQTVFADLMGYATSVKLLTKKENDLEKVMQWIFEKFEKWYLILRSGKLSEIDESYLKHFYKLGESCLFANEKGQFKAKISGVNEIGLLVLEMEDNTQKAFDIKEVKMIL